MRVFRIVPVMLGLTVFFSALIFGQTRTSGTLSGRVEDTTGHVVPNARVVLTGSVGTKSMITDDHGAFLFANLAPDTHYKLHAELAGFKASDAEDVEIRVGQTSTATMILQANEAGDTFLLDSSSLSAINPGSTSIGASVPDRLFQHVPINRTLGSIVQMGPGIANGNGTGTENPSISGGSGLENLTIIDGVDVTNPQFGANSTFNQVKGSLTEGGVNFDFIKDVDVQTGGFEAQYGQAMGGVVDVATKSGTNDIHGGLYQYYAPNALEATRKQPNAGLLNPGIEDHGQASYDLAGELGGYFVHDKMFWYAGINPVFNFNDIEAPMDVNYRLLGKLSERQWAVEHSLKLTLQPNVSNQFEVSYFADPSALPLGPHDNLARNVISNFNESDSKMRYGSRNIVARYSGTLSSHFATTLSISRMFNKFDETEFQNQYLIQDLVPVQTGFGGSTLFGGVGAYDNTRVANNQLNWMNSITTNRWGKSSFDFGYNFERMGLRDYSADSGPEWTLFATPWIRPQDIGLPVFGTSLRETMSPSGQLEYQVVGGTFSPSGSPYTSTSSRYHSAFAQETLALSRYVTLKAGVRWEQQQLFGGPPVADANSHHSFTGNWAPRLGFTIDPFGTNRMKLLFSYGRFYEKIPLDLAAHALSGQGQYMGMDFSSPNLTAANYLGGGFLSGGSVTPFAPGTRSQFEREYLAGVEKSVTDYNIKLGMHFERRDMERVLEDMTGTTIEQALIGEAVGNPVPLRYLLGNPTTGSDFFQNSAAPACPTCGPGPGGAYGADGIPDGFVNPIRRYWAWEFTAEKRFEEVWQMQTSYRYSSLTGNYEGLYRNDNFSATPNFSSMYNFPQSPATGGLYATGPLPTDQRHIINFYLTHSFPEYGWNVGIGAHMNSGTPVSMLMSNPIYGTPGDIPVGPRGIDGRTSTVTSLDGHADYTLNLSDRVKLRPNLDVFNVLNQQHITNVDQALDLAPGISNADFGKALPMQNARSPMAFQRPIFARLALRLEF